MKTENNCNQSDRKDSPNQSLQKSALRIVFLLFVGTLVQATSVLAEEQEYNFNWLDPDKKIYVLQNRRYEKSGKIMISALVGPGLSNPFRDVVSIEPRIAYYLNETWGVEVFYGMQSYKANNTEKAVRAASPTSFPLVRETKSQFGALVHYVPWYAKINVFNQILYFDWYFSGGLGQLATELVEKDTTASAETRTAKSLTGFFIGTGHQYHLSKMFTVRLDLTAAFYQAPLLGTSGASTLFSNYTFGAGLGVRL